MMQMPENVRSAVLKALQSHGSSCEPMRAYAVAEAIRQAHEDENLAVEDIVDAIIVECSHWVVLAIDPGDARNSVMGWPSAERAA